MAEFVKKLQLPHVRRHMLTSRKSGSGQSETLTSGPLEKELEKKEASQPDKEAALGRENHYSGGTKNTVSFETRHWLTACSASDVKTASTKIVLNLKEFFFSGEGPRSRRYGLTAALRLLVQPYDEDEHDDYYFCPFPSSGAAVE
jgi:hypothetical protein